MGGHRHRRNRRRYAYRKTAMTFTFDGGTLINLALLLAFIGFMWKLNRDVGLARRCRKRDA